MANHSPATLKLNELMGLGANHPFAGELFDAFPDWLENTPSFIDIKRWGDTKEFRCHGTAWNLTFMRIHKLKDILDFGRIVIRYEVKHEHRDVLPNKEGTEAFTGD